jgi:hypothetical protein
MPKFSREDSIVCISTTSAHEEMYSCMQILGWLGAAYRTSHDLRLGT